MKVKRTIKKIIQLRKMPEIERKKRKKREKTSLEESKLMIPFTGQLQYWTVLTKN